MTTVVAPEASPGGEQPRQEAGLACGTSWEPSSSGPQASRKQGVFPSSRGPCAEGRAAWRTGKKFLYCEPHKRIKEVLEEELYIKKDECHIKNPPAVALEGIWSIKRNLPMGGSKPALPSRNTLLPQAKFYSRHGGLRSKTPTSQPPPKP
ncbi:uncharacterized protein C11orf97 homolog isoform X1 [Artibeus jamaicensis]|uniref:uncharacterized protein C11orf97 homolog isoform X1 n=1 Tax=Artibeus jamaicensis TaxID=9417 RepID=UPI00235AA7C5|nr:uncharacterized protein C11orf97 homolog isoform X1 [Artibeus jamaicensis]XP_053526358.1 uncharacterized protein C11orf97 homolog isoform X1 [Artibeus jamaicensis]